MVRIIVAGIVVAGGFLVLRKGKKVSWAAKPIVCVVSVLYCLGLLYYTLLSRTPSSGNIVNPVPFYTIMRSLRYPLRLNGFVQKILTGRWQEVFTTLTPIRTAVLNVLLFMPMGYLMPEWFKGHSVNVWSVLLMSLIISGAIELIQLLTALGWCDVDDLICNLLGSVMGFGIYRIFSKIEHRRKEGMSH